MLIPHTQIVCKKAIKSCLLVAKAIFPKLENVPAYLN